ncbi:MAG: 16S rRNA (guanine(527)-N(7))-methyltransferase RsmG [Solirubrobacterales bacterium]|nr:16S rRNA (guanine(527)-N(7))-methyltransferase RsmG [Solirubrobacterales bacterium]
MNATERGVEELVRRYGLPPGAHEPLAVLLELLVRDPAAPTTVREPVPALENHLADALVALELEPVRLAQAAADIGSGNGVPGLPLAIAKPTATFSLVESNGGRSRFIERAAAACGLDNVEVVNARVEVWAAGAARFDLVTARALAPLPVVAEYAAPLLAQGGRLVAWRGKRDSNAEATAATAARELGLTPAGIQPVHPYAGAKWRHLHVFLKDRPTPPAFPRRPGAASKRPLGCVSGRSDRPQR